LPGGDLFDNADKSRHALARSSGRLFSARGNNPFEGFQRLTMFTFINTRDQKVQDGPAQLVLDPLAHRGPEITALPMRREPIKGCCWRNRHGD
jgi:hypothetical protein